MVALKRHPVFVDNASAAIVEKFILEQLNLIKDVVSEIKVPGLLFSVLLHHRIACDLDQAACLKYLLPITSLTIFTCKNCTCGESQW